MKDYPTRIEIVRCNSSGDLYPFPADAFSSATSARTFTATESTTDLWHRRLGHIGHDALTRLSQASVIPPPRGVAPVCHACQLGRHVRLPFTSSFTRASAKFEFMFLVFLVLSTLVILDDFSRYAWTLPLRHKSETFDTISHFFAFVKTQFSTTIRNIQCDNGREFDNLTARTFFLTNGVHMRMSCPHTCPRTVRLNACFVPSTT